MYNYYALGYLICISQEWTLDNSYLFSNLMAIRLSCN